MELAVASRARHQPHGLGIPLAGAGGRQTKLVHEDFHEGHVFAERWLVLLALDLVDHLLIAVPLRLDGDVRLVGGVAKRIDRRALVAHQIRVAADAVLHQLALPV